MNKKEWESKQKEEVEIESNYKLLEDIKIGSVNEPDTYFEYVVIRLFLALDNYQDVIYPMKLNEDQGFTPIRFAGGTQRDCFVSYDEFDLVVEPTRRPIYGSADHFSHLDLNPYKKQLGLVVVLDITKIDVALWDMFKEYCDNDGKLFMLCDSNFIFKLLKEQPTAFSKFQEFLIDSEKIWREEKDYKVIQKKIIALVKQEETNKQDDK